LTTPPGSDRPLTGGATGRREHGSVCAMRTFSLLALVAIGCVGPRKALDAPGGTSLIALAGGARVVHAEGQFQTKDGLHLFRQSWRPEQGKPRAVLVVVHGLRDHSTRYAELALAMAEKGFAVHAFDLRGHGHSEGIRAWVDPFEQYLEDLNLFLRAVAKEEHGLPLFLFGHSMGGAIVTLDVLTHRPPIAGLVLSAGALTRGKNVSGFLAASTKAVSVLLPHLDALSLDPAKFSRDPAVVRENKTDPLIFQDPAPARTAAGLLGALKEISGRRGELTAPLLALHGTADEVTDPDGSRALIAEARSKDKTLKLYEGFVHDLLHEPEKTQVLAEVVGWLDARAPRAP
jgi:acylglycerol lipase